MCDVNGRFFLKITDNRVGFGLSSSVDKRGANFFGGEQIFMTSYLIIFCIMNR